MKSLGSTEDVHWKLMVLSPGEEAGTPGGGVKSVDIRKNTGSEGELLASD